MSVSGVDTKDIAAGTGLTVKVVKGLLRRGNEKFNEQLAIYEEQANTAAGRHKVWLESRIEAGEQAIDAALNSTDKRLAAETGWKISDKVLPRQREPEAPPAQNTFTGDVEFKQVVLAMGEQFVELKEVLATQDPNKHVKTGAEALPRAIEATVVAEAVNEKKESEE